MICFNCKGSLSYDKKLFQELCNEMGLSLDEDPNYDEAITRMQVFYPPKDTKTIVLDNGTYTIVYDKTNSFPGKVLRHGEEWCNVVGDNLIFWLCE